MTALAVAGAVELEPLPPLVLKGKAEPVRASRAIAVRSEPSRELAMGRLRAPLQGRSAELAALRSAAERAAGGAAPRVLILAPPGVGKTRLVEEFAATLDPASGWSVLRVRVTAEAAAPFAPIARLVTAALDAGPGAARGAARGRRRARRIVSTGCGRRSPPASQPGRAATVVEHVRDLLDGGRRADRGGLGANARGAHRGSRRPLRELAPGPRRPGGTTTAGLDRRGPPLGGSRRARVPRGGGRGGAGVGAARGRHRPPERARGRPVRRAAGSGSTCRRWPPCDARALVDELTGSALPDVLAERIAARSDGNCLFIEELLRAWVGAGILVETDGGGVRLAVDPDEVLLPPTVQAVYAAQLDDLPGPARLAARRGSVCGRRFPVDVLPTLGIDAAVRRGGGARPARDRRRDPTRRRSSGASSPSATRCCGTRATRASGGPSEPSCTCARRAGSRPSPASAPTSWPAAIGGHYADAVAEAPALAGQVAAGLDRAAAASLAAGWLERAGDRALGLGARAGAAELFRRSVDLTKPDAGADLARRWRRVGEAIVGAGDLEEAAVAFGTAAEIARAALGAAGAAPGTAAGGTPTAAAGARRELALASAALSRARYEQIRFAEALAIAEEAIGVVGRDSPDAVPLLLARLRGIEGVSNDYAAVYRESADVLEAAIATGDRVLIFEARRLRLAFAANLDLEAADDWVALSREARALGRWSEAVGALSAASDLVAERDPAAAARLLDEAEAMAEARGLSERSRVILANDPGLNFGIGMAESVQYLAISAIVAILITVVGVNISKRIATEKSLPAVE